MGATGHGLLLFRGKDAIWYNKVSFIDGKSEKIRIIIKEIYLKWARDTSYRETKY